MGGHFSILFYEVKRRVFSQKKFYCLKKDLEIPYEIKKAKFDFSIRKMKDKDFNELFTDEIINSNVKEYKDYLRRRFLYDSKFNECYVSVDRNDRPVFIQWIMHPEEQNKIQKVFDNGIPKLKSNEVLFEGAYTQPYCRGKKIMTESLGRLTEIIKQREKRFLVAYVEHNNVSSVKALQNAGFTYSKTKIDIWRFFKRNSFYEKEVDKMCGNIL